MNLVSMGLSLEFAHRWAQLRDADGRPPMPSSAVRELREVGTAHPGMLLREACEWMFAVRQRRLFDGPSNGRWSRADIADRWVYAAAGLTVDEALALRDAGALPSWEQAALMAGLRG